MLLTTRPLPACRRELRNFVGVLNGEVMTTLDGEERKLDDQMLMITDEAGLIAIAGVMGEETEVGNETKDVLLESANFDFLNNRRTSQLLN